jgi:diketogulonate reductase-like aldo/keto reductase
MSKWKEHYKQAQIPFRELPDGRKIPAFGLGTLNIPENEVREVVRLAI